MKAPAVTWMFFNEQGNAFASYDSRSEAIAAIDKFRIDVPTHGAFMVMSYDAEGKLIDAARDDERRLP